MLYPEYCYITNHDYIGVLSHTFLLSLLPGHGIVIIFPGISLYRGWLYRGIIEGLFFFFFNENVNVIMIVFVFFVFFLAEIMNRNSDF